MKSCCRTWTQKFPDKWSCSCHCCPLLPLLQPSGFALNHYFPSLRAIPTNSQANPYPIPERLGESCSPPNLSATWGAKLVTKFQIPSPNAQLSHQLLHLPWANLIPPLNFLKGRCSGPNSSTNMGSVQGYRPPPSLIMQTEQSPVISGHWPEIPGEKGHFSSFPPLWKNTN